jgi:hypothetical protein
MSYGFSATMNSNSSQESHVPHIRLIRKLALSMNGVDVSRVEVGDTVEVDESQAAMMIESGWGEPAENEVRTSGFAASSRPRRNHSAPK